MTSDAIDFESVPTDELLKLENQMCFPLYACSKEVVRRYSPYLDQLDLTYTQYLVMLALWEYGSQSVGELGGRLYLDSGTLTPLLKKMETKGLLVRERDKADERRVTVTPTERGSALKEQAREVPLAMGQCVGVTAEEAAELVRLLGKVLANVQDSK